MAEHWIKMRTKLHYDGRVVALSLRLKRNRLEIIGALFTLWCIADEQGDRLEGYTTAVLSDMIGIKGFAEALPKCWLVADANGLTLPSYEDHNGQTAKKRAQSAARMQRSRGKDNAPEA